MNFFPRGLHAKHVDFEIHAEQVARRSDGRPRNLSNANRNERKELGLGRT